MSRTLRLAVALFMLVALIMPVSTATGAPRAAKATISGYVYGSDGIAIPGATVAVWLSNRNGVYNQLGSLTADSNGWWAYNGKGGVYRFDFSAPSSDPATEYLTVLDGVTYTLNVTLNSYGTIAGTIADDASGAPLAGATVELFRRAAGVWPTSPTVTLTAAADGTYSSDPVLAGQYRVRAIKAGYVAEYYGESGGLGPQTVAVNRGFTVTGIDIGLAVVPLETGTISGRVVRYATETPVANTYVWFYKRNADGTWPATTPGWGTPTKGVLTDSAGNYTSGDLPLGDYKVRLWGGAMTGSQWWQYVADVNLATIVPLTYGGQNLTGIDGWFNKPL